MMLVIAVFHFQDKENKHDIWEVVTRVPEQ